MNMSMNTKQLSFEEIKADIMKKIAVDQAFKAKFLSNPKEVLTKEYGVVFPNNSEIKVHENTDKVMHFVIPVIPDGKLSPTQLEAIAGGACYTCNPNANSVIGAANPPLKE